MMSTLQWTRPETNVRSRTTCCLSVLLPRMFVAWKYCFSCLRDWLISRRKPCRQDKDRAQRNTRWQWPNNVSSSDPQGTVQHAPQVESSTIALLANRSRSRVRQQNGQHGNSRSRHSRAQRIRRRRKSSILRHGKAQMLWSTVT